MSSISSAAVRTPGSGNSVRLSRLGDELLARQAARGSQRAFSVLYERYSQPIYRYCRSIVRHDADAQDALQATFTNALAALRRDGRNAPVRPWLYRIAHNESVSTLRRRRRDAQSPPVAESALVGASAEDEAAGRARWHRLVEDLAQLPDRQRGALLLRELAGLSHEEIGLSLGMSVGAAKQAIFEARQGLAEVEEGRAMSCDEVRRRISAGDRRVLRGRRVRAHLRDCAACGAFAVSISERQAELRALTPGLPPAVAAAVLGRVIHAASSHGGASAGSAVAAGAAGKAAGGIVGWKAVAAVGLVAGTAAGVTGLAHVVHHAPPAAHPVPARAEDPRATGHALGTTAPRHTTATAVRPHTRRHVATAALTAAPDRPHKPGSAHRVAARHAGASTLSATGSGHQPAWAQGGQAAGHPRHVAGSRQTTAASPGHRSGGGTGSRGHGHRVLSLSPKAAGHHTSATKTISLPVTASAGATAGAPKSAGAQSSAGGLNTAVSK